MTNTLLLAVGDVSILSHGEVTWTPVSGASGYNLYRGDLGYLRSTGRYTQDPGLVLAASRLCGVTDMIQDDGFVPAIGKAVFYYQLLSARIERELHARRDLSGAGKTPPETGGVSLKSGCARSARI